jgi:iron complex outermembrane receptor protein
MPEFPAARPSRRYSLLLLSLVAASLRFTAAQGAEQNAGQDAGSGAAPPVQEAASGTPAKPRPRQQANQNGVETVLVTARHRAEKAQTVPIGVTSVSAQKLTQNGISSITQLSFAVPTLQVTEFNPRNTSFNIRGVGNNVSVSNDGLEGGVGVYVDDVFNARPGTAAFDLPDIASVQVLRGPQGTLFGKNTTSGAIDVHTQLPSFTPDLYGEASIGNYGYWQFKASASDGINDKVAVRISVLGDQRDGTITSIVTGAHYNTLDDKAVRLQVLALPSDNLTLRFIVDYAHQLDNCCVNMLSGVFTTLENGTPIPYNFFQREKYTGYFAPNFNPFTYDTDIANKTYFEMETGGVSLKGDYDLNGYTLSSISAWRFWNWWPFNGAAPAIGIPVTNFGNQNDWQRQVTQEFRATSPTGGPIDWTTGFFFFYQDIPGFSHSGFGQDAGEWYFGSKFPRPLETAILNGYSIQANTDLVTNSYSGYGQATWHILPGLNFLGGLRYVYEDKSGSYNQFVTGGEPIDDFPIAERKVVTTVRDSFGLPLYYNNHAHSGSIGWLTSLTYALTPDVFSYATYSRGTKSPGTNVTNLPEGVSPIVKPERLDNYEAGLKTTWFDNTVLANVDVFWEEDSDYQGIVAAPLNSSGTAFTTYSSSIPKVQSRGFEWDTLARPFPWLSLNFAGAFTDAIYESYPNGQCPVEQVGSAIKICNLTGKNLPGNSRWVGSVGGEITQPIGTYWNHETVGYFGADFTLRSDFNVAANDSIYSQIPGYGLLDLRLGARTIDGKYDLFIWSRNATDTNYYLVRGTTAPFSGGQYGNIGDPLTFGATLRVHFK